ncbi:hypothetical protein GW17_00041255, partial [Ensete ventricosum]
MFVRVLRFVYIPCTASSGLATARYQAVSPKIDRRRLISTVGGRLKGEIDRRRSIEGEIDRRRSIEREKGKKKKKRKKKKKKKRGEKEYLSLARGPRPWAVAARGSRALFLPRGENDRGD